MTAKERTQLPALIQNLHQELDRGLDFDTDRCMDLIQAIAAEKLPSKRTPQMDKMIHLAKRKVKGFPTRSASSEFQRHVSRIERSWEIGESRKKKQNAAAPKVDTSPDGSKMTGQSKKDSTSDDTLPKSVNEYLKRLTKQGKELYKNPPVLPPSATEIYEEVTTTPKRDDKSERFSFSGADMAKKFRPNRSPEEILRGGAFGGTYFRSIDSAVTNQRYNGARVVRDTLPEEWRKGLNEPKYLTSSKYDEAVNKFGAKCGGSLGMWESSGWISDADPYGWFQWYCRFFQGRRTSDDARQIQRWMGVAGPRGRFKSQLCNKIIAANTHAGDTSISPVIRQTMWHWGLEVTDDILEEHRSR